MSRRIFMVTAGVLTLIGIFSYPALRYVKKAINPNLNRNHPPGRLSDQDMRTMLALLEVLVPQRLWISQENMVKLVNDATEQKKGLLKEYQSGLNMLDQLTKLRRGKLGFANISLRERSVVLESILWKYEGGRQKDLSNLFGKIKSNVERLFLSKPERHFRDFVVRDLLVRFYSGEAGWKLAGYTNYPGVPGNPREYVGPGSLSWK
ncbi:MAG TPA: hypothetical protein VGB26_06250 [Nitrospiria bacterium]